ncbi:MAG: DEAD/DEAH box helicase [Acidobacteria bacterium]|nr:DEAD/DEAH box helicase [Acidobacteriota bacterium]
MSLSAFYPAIQWWFSSRLGEPTEAQHLGWPLVGRGLHTLIAAPTGSGKTLAGFLWAIGQLLKSGPALPDAVRVLYVSPLRALSNDEQKNLQAPLAEMRALEPALPALRVDVRTGDTSPV